VQALIPDPVSVRAVLAAPGLFAAVP